VEAGVSYGLFGFIGLFQDVPKLGAHKVQELVQPVMVVSDVALMNGTFNDISC